MRRIDVIGIGLAIFIVGGLAYIILQQLGLDRLDAGIWSQVLLMAGLVGWLLTYLFRFATNRMTYNQQLENYKEAVLQKRFEELTPEELAKLQEEIQIEKAEGGEN
jgi:membrane protein implicated in regulation of membrane protease activity